MVNLYHLLYSHNANVVYVINNHVDNLANFKKNFENNGTLNSFYLNQFLRQERYISGMATMLFMTDKLNFEYVDALNRNSTEISLKYSGI